ncbi:MAG: LLM class flavin-dependent oxidoreductase [Pseudomonadales bacterium]|nr:LLM class flavin-dependent oxidoreductase [Pseudomonadales bacterium]
MQLSVLDQSIVRTGSDARTALAETLELARFVERLGYTRIWVSEHHDSPVIAGSSPEVLLAAIGAATSRIRIGSGGVMLPHYSAYKVAENFAVLSNLYPDRVDLGVGRAPGADMNAAIALASDGRPKFERFPQLVKTLTEALWNPDFKPRVGPTPYGSIPVWVLGTSPDSALLAAELGLPYSVALFINPQFDPRIVELYRQRFRPSVLQREPRVMIAMNVFCAETMQQAETMTRAADLTYIRFLTQRGAVQVCSPEEAEPHRFSAEERAFVQGVSAARAVGTAETVRERVEGFARNYQADEVMAVCNTFHFSDRLRSFELLAQAFGLEAGTAMP